MAGKTTPRLSSGRGIELALVLLAIMVIVAGDAGLDLAMSGHVSTASTLLGVALGVMALGVHGVLRWRARYADPVLLPVTLLLNGIGLIMIRRLDLAAKAGTSVAGRQLIWTGVGVAGALALLIMIPDHRKLSRRSYTAMAGGLGLLLLPLTPVLGRSINGAHIWIVVAGMSFQPGEVAKVLLAVFFASYLMGARDQLSLIGRRFLGITFPRGRDLGPLLVIWGVSLVVLVFETDLGMSLLYFGLFVAMLYVATERFSWIILGMLLFSAGAVLAWQLFAHVQLRVSIWMDPFGPANKDRAYQLVQGLYGLAAGGLTGTGLGQGQPWRVPFANSDFIVTALGEELGLAGLMVVFLLYLVLVERGLRAAVGVRDTFGKLLASGLAFSIVLQVFVVAGGVTRVIPLAGLTMPFLAAGGSSLVASWAVVALLLRISDAARRPAPEQDLLLDPDDLAPPLAVPDHDHRLATTGPQVRGTQRRVEAGLTSG
jgi:cell division protein FtsW (lipid II flippase)